jgi:hypothetical protein
MFMEFHVVSSPGTEAASSEACGDDMGKGSRRDDMVKEALTET